jgi:sulfatase maturation enzyme AslB (radical SAM superfamily)
MTRPVLRKAVALLLSTHEAECRLRFWGGEPLLQWDFIKDAIVYAQKQAFKRKKKITFMITTNGLLLDSKKISFLKKYPVEIMFSLDGGRRLTLRHRFALHKQDYYGPLLANLECLKKSGIPFFVNMVVAPDTTTELLKSICFLRTHAVERIQLCYQTGIRWLKDEKDRLINELAKIRALPASSSFLMNFTNHCEPTMLSQEILVDTDGKMYFDAAIFMEKTFPELRKYYFLGDVFQEQHIDSFFKTKYSLYKIFNKACSLKQRDILDNNIDLGITLDDFFNAAPQEALRSNEHPALIPFIRGAFKLQKEQSKQLSINSLFLYIDGPCANDCIFCTKKQGEGQADLLRIKIKLKENRVLRVKKLCVIGNDPLLYDDIFEVVELAKTNGFETIEIMTSGECLADKAFTRCLIQRGASSFSLPLFSNDPRVHDTIVGTRGSYRKVLRGIKNAAEYGARTYIHTNVLKQNIGHLLALEEFVKGEMNKPFIALPVRPKTANMPLQNLMPSYADIKSLLQGINCLVAFPLCVVQKVQKDLIKSADEISDSMKIYLLDQRFIKLKECKECLFKQKCLGIINGYRTLYGADEICRIKAKCRV